MKRMVHSHSASSAELVAENDDLLLLVLARLPVQPLLIFKSVSKHWRSLISDPNFCTLHTLLNPSSRISGLILRTSSGEYESFLLRRGHPRLRRVNPLGFLSGIRILQSCKGLLLCCTVYNDLSPNFKLYVVNPTTQQFKELPPLLFQGPNVRLAVLAAGLAFDPGNSVHYKVICVRCTNESMYQYQVEMYSSEVGTWRLSGEAFTAEGFDMVFGNEVFWNGAIHWVGRKNWMYFDVEGERLGMIRDPPFVSPLDVVEYRGDLYCVETNSNGRSMRLSEMERDFSGWAVKEEVDLFAVRVFLGKGNLVMLSIVEGGDEEPWLLLHVPSMLVGYNIRSKESAVVYDLPLQKKREGALRYGRSDAFHYIESLVCV